MIGVRPNVDRAWCILGGAMSVDRLVEAADTGEIIEIVYFGGNQPGTRREVTVRDVVDGYLEARCLATDMPKTFRLDLVEVWNGDAAVPVYDAGQGRSAARARGAARKGKRRARAASDGMIRGMSSAGRGRLVELPAMSDNDSDPASERMIAGMSGVDVRVPPTEEQRVSARLVDGMARVESIDLDVDTGWISPSAVRIVVHSGDTPPVEPPAIATVWQRLRRALGWT
jgi:hypothetical protein